MDDKMLQNIINWYPGHMKKTVEQIKNHLKLVDLVVEIVDARAPISTKNPQIDEITYGKEKIVVMSKADLAKEKSLDFFVDYHKKKGIQSFKVNLLEKSEIKKVLKYLNDYKNDLFLANKEKNIIKKPLSIMVVGIPNVGKSTFINAISGTKKVKAANTPGVTKGKQWIKIKGDLQILDTPGVLWPKISDEKVAVKLAILGSIKDRLLDIEEIYYVLIKYFIEKNEETFFDFFEIKDREKDFETISQIISEKRGYILKGNNIDYNRLANEIINDYRTGKLGKVQLDEIEG